MGFLLYLNPAAIFFQISGKPFMNKRFFKSLILLMLTFALAPEQVWAVQAFTSDSQEVPLRSGASLKNRTIFKIPPASMVDVVNQPEWFLVRYTGQDGEAKQGWVSSSLLSFHPPETVVVSELRAENRSLREQAESSEKEKQELARTEKELSDKYAKLEADYEALKSGSGSYIQLKEEYDSLKSALAGAQENIQTLLQENDSLKFSQTIRSFAAGAAVLLAGLVIGWAVGKRLKRRRSNFYM
jgi:SH3 domain protein